jgi:hypothetical protein
MQNEEVRMQKEEKRLQIVEVRLQNELRVAAQVLILQSTI